MASRIEARLQVLGCQECSLRQKCSSPVPFSGPAPSKIAVIGEAPGESEDREGKPFVGPSGRLARGWLAGHGIQPDSVAWLNVVSCWPRGTPTKKEVEACRRNLDTQLATIRPDFCLLFGGVAVSPWWEIRIGEIRGQWWRLPYPGSTDPSGASGSGASGSGASGSRGAWAMATWHPSAVLRNPQLQTDVDVDVDFFAASVVERKGTDSDLPLLPPFHSDWCVKCGRNRVEVRDEKGIGWCLKHSPEELRRLAKQAERKAQPKRAKGKRTKESQQSLMG